jgi:thioredoxin reductase (NADPH)
MEKLTIIGSGPAGLTAALYAARANIHPVLIEGARVGGISGGQLMNAGVVENFPGQPKGLAGPMLIAQMREQLAAYAFTTIAADVTSVDLKARPFTLRCSNGQTIESGAILIATGAMVRRLPLPSEVKFWEKGISACAICDGGLPLFRNNRLAVIGGGDSAAEEALFLTRFGSKVYLIHHRDKLRASRILQDRVMENPKIEMLWNKTVTEFHGDEFLSGLTLKDEKTGELSRLEVRGAFEAIGHLPNTNFLVGHVDLDASGHILTRQGMTSTSVDGVFTAGDVADRRYRQAITASGSGCMAALDAERWLQEQGLL